MADKKRLMNDLRVIDLRVELEKRKLDKTGVRAVLLKRLSQYLKDEGQDPDTFLFDAPAAEVKTPSKRSRTENSVDAETEEGLEGVRVEDMIVQDDVGDEDEVEEETKKNEDSPAEEPKTEQTEIEKPEVQQNRKRELNEEPEAVQAKKPCIQETKQDVAEEGKIELNNTDAEDSINLDIGEDELLNDDTESTVKTPKEEGGAEEAAQPATVSSESTPSTRTVQQQAKSDDHTTSENADDKKDKDDKEAKGDENGSKKEEAKDGSTSSARNLWVSGLSGDTRAKDLKQLCSKHGKVIGAKVVTNARTPGSRCYGYVTMASAQDAENCIKNLHRTELHGRMISVEKAKSEASGGGPANTKRKEEPRRKSDDKKDGEPKKEGEENGEEKAKTDTEEKTDSVRSRSRDKNSVGAKRGRERSRERKRSPREALSFNKIWKERDRERSRLARDEDRRRRQAEEEMRERERQQRQENRRLAQERHKLRLERERIEREKKELLRLERERHKLEREKLELERLELKRAQLRLEEERRKRSYEAVSSYRKPNSPPMPPQYERDRHKRPPLPSVASRGAFEAPPPPRFELATPAYERASDKRDRADYKREYNPRHISSSGGKYPSNGTSTDAARPPLLPGTRPKEPVRTTYEGREGRSAGYRSPPPTKPEGRTWTSSSRYQDTTPPAKDYPERSSSSWTAPSKSYPSSRHAVSATAPAHNWTKPSGGVGGSTSETWQSSSGPGGASERYSSSSSYEPRSYPAAYQPPPPGAAPYTDRYPAASTREYRHKY